MKESSGGIGFLGLLGIVFIVLKLTGVITWNWCLVLLPLYAIPLLFLVIASVFAVGVGILFFIALIVEFIKKKLK